MKSRWLWTASVITAAMAGCNGLAGIREGIFDPCMQDAGDPICVTGSATAASGSGSGSATTGGVGGSRTTCGNGVVDPDEECDDKSPAAHGCTACKVDCAEPGAFKDPATAHCYWVQVESQSFFESNVTCELTPGGRLSSVTTPAELAMIATHLESSAWIGASALGTKGEIVWLDDEPWVYSAWAPGEPKPGGKNLCVKLGGQPLLFEMDDCALARSSLCERAP